MKKGLLLLMLAGILQNVHAEEVFLASTADGKSSYYAYTETILVNKQGEISVMVAERRKGQNDARSYKGVTPDDCSRKYGILYHRMKLTDQWQPILQWTSSGSTVSDAVAVALCGVLELRKNEI